MAQNNGDIGGTAAKAGVALVALLLIAFILATIAGPIVGEAGEEHEFEPTTEENIYLSDDSEVPEGFEVVATQEYAVQIDGDGYVAGDEPDGWADGNWSACLVANANADEINEQATYNLLSYDNATILLEYHSGEWRAIHYVGDESATVTADATDTTETPICTAWDGVDESLSIYVDGTLEDSSPADADDPDRQVANDWIGWIDEVRLVNATIGESTASTYAEDPVDPLEVDHDARLMFNEGEGDETTAYYQGATWAVVNAEWVDGVEGPELLEGTDYAVETNPLELQLLESGYLDGAPVGFASWDGNPFGNLGVGLIGMMATVLSVLAIAILAMAAAAIMGVFESRY